MFLQVWRKAITNKNKTLLDKTESQIETIFTNCWQNIAPSGMHSLRHGFATSHLIKHKSPIRVASWMGHESLRVLQITYDQGLYFLSKEYLSQIPVQLPQKLSQDELYSFLAITKTTVNKKGNPFTTRKPIISKIKKRFKPSEYGIDSAEIIGISLKKITKKYSHMSARNHAKVLLDKSISRTKKALIKKLCRKIRGLIKIRKKQLIQLLPNTLNKNNITPVPEKKNVAPKKIKIKKANLNNICKKYLNTCPKKRKKERYKKEKCILNKWMKVIGSQSGKEIPESLLNIYVSNAQTEILKLKSCRQYLYVFNRLINWAKKRKLLLPNFQI